MRSRTVLAAALCLCAGPQVLRSEVPLPQVERLKTSPVLRDLKPNPMPERTGKTGEDTLAQMHVPEGFRVEVVAAEPDVQQPVAFTFDERGRIWVVEAYSYPQKRPDGQGLDKVVILADQDGDGKFETRKVFAEGLNLASAIEVGYGGVWDPDYAYTASGALFATTFDGLKVSRDAGCTFDSTPPGNLFVSADELAPNGALTFASVDPTDDKVYKSTDDGMTFPTSTTPPGAMVNDWYSSLIYQNGSSTNVWLSGYRFVGNTKTLLVWKSTNGGASFTSVTVNGITRSSSSSALTIAGIDAAGNAYAVVSYPDGQVGGDVYRLAPAAAAWVQIATYADGVSPVQRTTAARCPCTTGSSPWSSRVDASLARPRR